MRIGGRLTASNKTGPLNQKHKRIVYVQSLIIYANIYTSSNITNWQYVYLQLYKKQTDYFQTRNYELKEDVTQYKNKTDNTKREQENRTSHKNPKDKLKQQGINT